MMPVSLKMTVGRSRMLAAVSLSVAVGVLVSVAPAQASFEIETFENSITAQRESPYSNTSQRGPAVTRAGAHPYEITTTIAFVHHKPSSTQEEDGIKTVPNGDPKDIIVNFPAGLVVNPNATQQRCTEVDLLSNSCPDSSAIGVIAAHGGVFPDVIAPVYNMVTPANVPADFASNVAGVGLVVHITGKIRTGGDYGGSGEVSDISQNGVLYRAEVTLWGIPSDKSHDKQRGSCGMAAAGKRLEREEQERQKELEEVHGEEDELRRVYFCAVERTGKSLMTMPTSCIGPLQTTMEADSWQESGFIKPPPVESPGMTGCEELGFNPSLSVQPDTDVTDSPSGLDVKLDVPQEENASGLAESNIKEAVVTLPPGMTVNPSAANGLGACTDTPEPATETEPERPGGEIELQSARPVKCPPSSKVGVVEAATPLLTERLHGSVYLAQQGKAVGGVPAPGVNPFGSLVAVYLVLEGSGVVVKLPGEVQLNPVTGQVTTRFGEDPLTKSFLPEQPVSELKLHLFGGSEAALVTPSACGTYTTQSSLTPYSAPESGPPATPTGSFEVTQGCVGQFSPSFVAGTQDNQAAAFSPFTFTLSREDSEQDFGRIQTQIPPGLLAMVSSVPLCEEPQATEGTCPAASLIGHVTAGAGAGERPFYVTGQVFLTGPYDGAPYGLSIVVPAVAGPFNLGLVKLRAAIDIDPNTAAVTVTSDPLPQIVEGVPLLIRKINVSIDREHFFFNPTNCNPLSIGTTVTGTQGASAALSSRYQAANCSALGFHPKLKATASGHASRANGTSMDFKIVYPAGTQANIAQAKVELPKRLPSRLTTLQKACLAQVFEANPASCPAASVVGIARATTPVLPNELTGPVYLVSHGGEAFPNVVVVLQGDGVRADVVGSTFISKAGVTRSTFKTVPDVPVSSFELYLPQARYSVFTANGNLCKGSLKMPTTFVGQNGAEVHEDTTIAVSGCPRAKTETTKNKRASRAGVAGAGRDNGRRG
jgi:hypothetical protein